MDTIFPHRPRDMVLAKFSDGFFYRACCIEVSDRDAKLVFIDYGSVASTSFDSIMPLPIQLLYTCFSHTCKVKLASGEPLTNINIEKTNNLLLDKNEFEARVEKDGTKFLITLDDSLVVMN